MMPPNIKKEIDKLIKPLSDQEKIWLSGYIYGISHTSNSIESNTESPSLGEVSIIYATETGNSKKIATELAKRTKASGTKTKLKAMEQYRFSDIKKETHLVLITSTHGDGELPQVAKGFYKSLQSEQPNLSNLNYQILALGDSNYPLFCNAGKLFDEQLNNLKATRTTGITKLDLDWADHIENWYKQVVSNFSTNSSTKISPTIVTTEKKPNKAEAKVLEHILLNDHGSNKEIYHIELEAELDYEPGDALGIKLEGQTPRLYSIASSPQAHDGEVHLTVKKVEGGLCSTHLSKLKKGDSISCYISKNNSFKLPSENTDIIMVGAGTGIAPFRSFLAEREASSTTGKNWLFFGEQYARTDFLYQTEWQEYLESGTLNRLDLAFSRDQKEKIYVQDRMKEKSEDIRSWLKNNAYFYVCGDKNNLGKDVEQTLQEILGPETFEQLKNDGRYLADTY